MEELKSLWEAQIIQQKELGLDPDGMSDVERARAFVDYLANLYEEVAATGRARPVYKRHLLKLQELPSGVLDGCVSVVKMAFVIAQLQGVTYEEFSKTFLEKTEAIKRKSSETRLELSDKTRVLAFDVDDVLADLDPWRESCGATNGESFAQKLSMDELMKHHFYEGGGFRELPPVEGAPEAMRSIREEHKALHVLITARPQWKYKRLRNDTTWWLKKHNIPYDMLLFARNKAEALYEYVYPAWPKAFVEDHPRNANDLHSAGVDVILFDRPHNRSISIGERVVGWKEVEKALRRRFHA